MCDLPILAERIARQAHAGQVDKAGQPYVGHLERVVANLLYRWPDASEDEIAAAWLHDVIEDTPWTVRDLAAAGVPRNAFLIVQELTHLPEVSYRAWISDIVDHRSLSAVRVKIADLDDNMDPDRVAAWDNGPRMVRERYAPARALLLARVARDG